MQFSLFTIKTFLVMLTALIASCAQMEEKTSVTAAPPKPKPDPVFKKFVRQFNYQSLPLVYYACKTNTGFNPRIEPTDKFGDAREATYAYCTFKTNGDYVALVTTLPADCNVPVITTYNRQGKVIDKKDVMIGRCGADCGSSCTEYLSIDKDLNIYVCDSIVTEDCDQQSRIIPNTKKEYVLVKKGKLLANGKIELSGEEQVDLGR